MQPSTFPPFSPAAGAPAAPHDAPLAGWTEHYARAQIRRDALNEAWRAVDALGGTYSAEEQEERWADGHHTALTDACDAIFKLGGRDPDPDVGQLRRRIRELEAEVSALKRGVVLETGEAA